jgi:Na+/proline symporter/nitrogen-specific signal transduction histidine kinase
MIVLRKIILISKNQRITSIADFISSRYGKSVFLGILVVVVSIFGIVPYISIQLKAISTSLHLLLAADPLTAQTQPHPPFYWDSAFYVTLALALFSILFGTRHLDPNERHTGMVAAIAFESVFKLLVFLAVGLFVVFGMFNGVGDLFEQAMARADLAHIFTFDDNTTGTQWFWLTLVSLFAFLFLPRQFHIAVVENDNPDHLRTASWLLPLYLLLINLFVVPIAVAGSLLLSDKGISPDTFVLTLPLLAGQEWLAFLSALGGFSAATGMVIVATIAMSIMISNNLILPLVIGYELAERSKAELPARLLGIRRISILVVLLLSYSYFRAVGEGYSLVSIGLISFLAVAQFAPAVFFGIYWKRANRWGAISGLIVGFLVWLFTLPFTTLIEAGIFDSTIMTEGLMGIQGLRPQALLGLTHLDPFSHAAFWSLTLNTLVFVGVSLLTTPTPLGVQQAELFVNIEKYFSNTTEMDLVRRQASVADIRRVMQRFLGGQQAKRQLRHFEKSRQVELASQQLAGSDLINFTETQLTGALGAASAKIIIASITKTDPVSVDEMLVVLEQTREIIQYSKALEKKSHELELLTEELRMANEQLQQLDHLKADFISTVTHELRTPITSIKAFAKILADNPQLDAQQKAEFLDIVVSESERVSRLINQVLDLEKIQAAEPQSQFTKIDLNALVQEVCRSLRGQLEEREAQLNMEPYPQPLLVEGNKDRLTQVFVNLCANAVKFCEADGGQISIAITTQDGQAVVRISNNGTAIPPEQQKIIFDRFTQLQDPKLGKPKGSGLGLYISKHIVERHGGILTLVFLPNWATSFEVTMPLASDS